MAAGDAFRRILDRGRSIASRYGLRPFSVSVRVTTWSGASVGVGTATVTETPILVGGQNPKVSEIGVDDAVASGNLYDAGDLRVGPLTPTFPGGGVSFSTVNPATSARPTEVQFIVTRAGVSKVYIRIADETDSALHHFVTIREKGKFG